MTFTHYFPWTSRLCRSLTGRFARGVSLVAILLVAFAMMAAHLRSYLLVRKFQPVLAGLSRIRIDETTEAELVQTVPNLLRGTSYEAAGTPVATYYYILSSNESDWLMQRLYSAQFGGQLLREPLNETADWLGYRYLSLAARVLVVNGKVSSVGYAIATKYVVPSGIDDFISVQSVHGFWSSFSIPVSVRNTDDESPQFRVSGDEKSLSVKYTFDAPPARTAHAFRIDLSCFWTLRACQTVSEVAPLLWQDRNDIQAKALARENSADPCPDRILAGRARYLPDIDVLLLDVMDARKKEFSGERSVKSAKFSPNFGLREVVHGRFPGSGQDTRRWYNREIPSPPRFANLLGNSSSPLPQVGDRFLLFAHAEFESCKIVPARASALSAVQAAAPTAKHREDEIIKGRM
jgi:hypothetical protein